MTDTDKEFDALLAEALASPDAEVGRARVRVGRSLRRMRKELDLTQMQLAQRAGIPQPTISEIENGAGEHGATVSTLARLAAACGYEFDLALRPSGPHAAPVAVHEAPVLT